MAEDTASPEKTNPGPQLPPASVDFNALHDALAAGKSPEDALSAAVVDETVALSAAEAEARAAASVAEAPKLGGLSKADLAPIAEAELVTHALDRDGNVIPFAEASHANMVAAIEARRAGSPIIPPPAPAE